MYWDNGIVEEQRWGAVSAGLAGIHEAAGPIEGLTMRREVMGA